MAVSTAAATRSEKGAETPNLVIFGVIAFSDGVGPTGCSTTCCYANGTANITTKSVC